MVATTERYEMRISPQERGLLMRAAEIEGLKLSQFMLGTSLKRARAVIAQAQATQVMTSQAGYQKILDDLANPPEPSKNLVDAMREYAGKDIQWR